MSAVVANLADYRAPEPEGHPLNHDSPINPKRPAVCRCCVLKELRQIADDSADLVTASRLLDLAAEIEQLGRAR